jgi:hypothetical protein
MQLPEERMPGPEEPSTEELGAYLDKIAEEEGLTEPSDDDGDFDAEPEEVD